MEAYDPEELTQDTLGDRFIEAITLSSLRERLAFNRQLRKLSRALIEVDQAGGQRYRPISNAHKANISAQGSV